MPDSSPTSIPFSAAVALLRRYYTEGRSGELQFVFQRGECRKAVEAVNRMPTDYTEAPA